jgi:subtilase family serine protease
MNSAAGESLAVKRPGAKVPPVLLAMLFLATLSAPASGMQVLPGHVPQAIRTLNLQPVGRLPSTQLLRLAIELPLRDQAGLTNLLADLYNPDNPRFHQFLTPEEFTARFGPAEADYAAVAAFARTNGLEVTANYSNRRLLDVRGAVADIERAFHVTLRLYPHPREPRNFYAPDTEPSLDLAVPVAGIHGLDNFAVPRPAVTRSSTLNSDSAATPAYGSGMFGAYMGADFRAAYAPDVSLTGAGQTVALVQFDGFYRQDITAYENSNNLPDVPLQIVFVDDYNGAPDGGDIEVSLDIEMAISMAPGLSRVLLYEAGPSGIPDDVFNQIVTDNAAKQISSSWINFRASDGAFQEMAAQGQSFFNAAGDHGAEGNGAGLFPADDPYVISVGGTTLSTTGPGGAYVSETTWNEGFVTNQNEYLGTGGGISSSYAIPYWQTNVSMTLSQGSTTMRNYPDISMVADNVLDMYDGGTVGPVVGTSCAAPLWAAFMALVNEQAGQGGNTNLGFIDPLVYNLGGGTNYAAAFHDVTTGNNTNGFSPNEFFAAAGYDQCTGWGTPAGQKLINSLTPAPVPIIVPDNGFSMVWRAGTAFAGTNESFTLTNNGGATLNWSLVNTSAWLNVSVSGGTLPGGAVTNTGVSLTPAVTNLPIGTYSASVIFSNRTTRLAQTRVFTLEVAPLVINGDFETGDLSWWTLAGDGQVSSTLYDGVIASNSIYGNCAHSGLYGMAMGDTNIAYLSQSLPTVAGQDYLLSFWLENLASGSGEQFLVNWNTSAPTTSQIFNQSYTTAFAWTNLQFLVQAAGPTTVLQFGALNIPDLFGLDDISVAPVNPPVFQVVSHIGGTIQLTWSATNGFIYQLQSSTNLVAGGWVDLGGPQAIVSGQNLSATDTNAMPASGQRFYRVLMTP